MVITSERPFVFAVYKDPILNRRFRPVQVHTEIALLARGAVPPLHDMPTLTGMDMGSNSGAFSAETTCIQRRKTGLLLEQGNAMLKRIQTASDGWRRIGGFDQGRFHEHTPSVPVFGAV